MFYNLKSCLTARLFVSAIFAWGVMPNSAMAVTTLVDEFSPSAILATPEFNRSGDVGGGIDTSLVYCDPTSFHHDDESQVGNHGSFADALALHGRSAKVHKGQLFVQFKHLRAYCEKSANGKFKWQFNDVDQRDKAQILRWKGFASVVGFQTPLENGSRWAKFVLPLEKLLNHKEFQRYSDGQAVEVKLNIHYWMTPNSATHYVMAAVDESSAKYDHDLKEWYYRHRANFVWTVQVKK